MKSGATKRYLILTTVLVALATGYTWYWYVTADKIRARVPEIGRVARELGYSLDLAEPVVSGFPYRFVVDFPSIELARPAHADVGNTGGVEWRLHAEQITGYAQPWSLAHTIFEFKRPLSWSRRGHTQVITSDLALLSLSFDGKRLRRLSVDVHGASVSAPGDDAAWRVGRLQAHVRPISGRPTPDAVQISVTVNDLVVPNSVSGALDRRVRSVRATGTLGGWSANFGRPTDAGTGARTNAALELDEFTISWPPMAIEGSGTLALDPERRPTGSIHVLVHGHEALVDRLQTSGVLGAGKAATTRAALGLLQSGQGNAEGWLAVKVELQGGRLYLGPIKLLRLPSF